MNLYFSFFVYKELFKVYILRILGKLVTYKLSLNEALFPSLALCSNNHFDNKFS